MISRKFHYPLTSGQFVKHYATNCNTILISTNKNVNIESLPIKDNIAIIDIGNLSIKLREKVKYYDNLSEINNVEEAISEYYNKLRKFEKFNENEDIKVLYLISNIDIKDEKYVSLIDRMFRTSSGKVVNLI